MQDRNLEDITSHSPREISRLSQLTAAQRHRLLVEWNYTQTEYPFERCIHRLFEAQVARSPDAVAVVFGEQQLTYRELNTKANQVGHHLKSLGVGLEVLVGICVERSLEMVVGLLGILKAEGAYVPLDPSYPIERLTYMVEDAQIEVLLTQQYFIERFVRDRAKIVCLDTEWESINRESKHNLTNSTSSDNLAYVIYTSGSTGKPKGVAVPHRAVNRLVINTNYIQLDPTDRVAQVSNISFDAATFEVWGALLHGAQLVLIPKDVIFSPQEFAVQIQAQKITVLFLTTALFNQLSRTIPQVFQSLRTLLFGGEAVDPQSVKEVLRNGAPGRLVHVYGPTENTTFSSWYLVREVPQGATTLPIGRPISNTQIYLLDGDRQPVPIGVPGELYLGGDGLACCYLNRPELTKTKFIPNAFTTNGGDIPKNSPIERLYKTGDLARYLPDGNIEFLGRIDTQVKIRGFRIELGEIEAVLTQYRDIAEAVAIARENIPGDKYLVAYIVPSQKQPIVSEVREFCKDKLPDYMVPVVFVVLEKLPLTLNGKVDRNALPVPNRIRPEIEAAFVAPRDRTEEILASIWSEVLGLEPIGIQDNLFELGGHSLIATQILSRVRDVFQVSLAFPNFLENPTIANLSQFVQQCGRVEEDFQFLSLQPTPREGRLPVSFAQERVYFIEQLAPNRAYQFQSTLRFKGQLDVSALQQSINEIVRRHEIFRTTLPAIDGRPFQVIHPPPTVNLPIVDVRIIPDNLREQEVQRLIGLEVQKPFDLTQLPLVRWTLFQLSDREHVLIHIEHHIVHDGWSFNIFLHELIELYKAFSGKKASPLDEPSLQFVDFASWQRQWVLGEAAKQQLAYWQQKLSGSSPLLELPYDRPRPTEQSYRGDSLRMELPLGICEALRGLSRQEGKTLFMTMFGAFLALLHRYTGRDDLSVGTAVANRRLPGTEGLIGMIVNNLVLRTDLSGNPTFRELLNRVRQVTLEAYANEDLPFDKVVEVLNPIRNLNHNPLFQVMFSFHDSPMWDLKLPELDLTLYEAVSNKSAKFDLDVVVIPRFEQRVGRSSTKEGAKGILLIWEYNSDLFDATTIERMMGHYQNLLEGIGSNLEQRVSELPILNTAQKHQLLVKWNKTNAEYSTDRCIHELFEAQVERTPDALAIVDPCLSMTGIFGSEELTYWELNAKANQLAHYLQTLGVGPDVLVGICMDRSLEMIVGLLGILKAGGAYVPLDPSYPAERLRYVVNDAQVSVLLTKQKWAAVESQHTMQIVCIDSQWEFICQRSRENPASNVGADCLVYAIYTSGSTGQPKGVAIEHRSLVNFTQVAIAEYEISHSERVLQFASIGFDAAAEEIYPCLSSGGTLILRSEEMLKSAEEFVQQSRDLQVTLWDLPTAYWHLICSELASGNLVLPESLRLVIIGGERALPDLVKKWHQSVGDSVRLVNTYGPTEATVVTTLRSLSAERFNGQEVSIGRPINNVRVYILDKYLQPVPMGVPGELHIAGAGLARGYLNRPELTSEKFISNPFAEDSESRLYKTGDLVRYLPNGNLEFLGRMDTQVKIRGFRIELGEIEAALNQHSQVLQSVVIAREDIPGNKRLVAYIVADSKQNGQSIPYPNTDELRHSLQQKLPPYMVPSAFVMLDTLPMTSSGKVDRHALPAPDTSALALDPNLGKPRTPTEERLVAIWAEVLGLARVSIHDNFFELGGDSIISIQMISRALRAGLRFTPKQLFQYQTIADLASVVSTKDKIQANQGIVTGSVALTPIQHWFWEQNLPEPHHFNQSILLEVRSNLKPDLLQQALQQLLVHHDILRLRFARAGDESWQQTIAIPNEAVPFQVVDLSELSPEKQQVAIETKDGELQTNLNLSSGPIVGVILFTLSANQRDRLLFVIHHLAVDGISWGILLKDFATIYQQLADGKDIQLPLKTTAFQDWANRLVEYGQSQVLATELNYWLPESGYSATILPLDYPWDGSDREVKAITSTTRVSVSLSKEKTRALLQDVPSAYNTQINDVLLTALVQSFAQWTGENSLLVDLEGHGREDLFVDVDLSRTVGWFTTLFPVHLNLESVDRPGEALKSIKEQLRRIPKRGIGYGVLRYLCQDDAIGKQLQSLPQAQVSFNYLGQFDRVLSASTILGSVKELKSEQSSRGNRSHLLGVSGFVSAGKLEMTFAYSDRVHRRETIECLADSFIAALKNLIVHCQSPDVGSYTPSDFSANKLSQKGLDKLISKIKKNNRS